MCEEIQQTVDFGAAPARVFDAYVDSREHAQFSGEPAEISRESGGSFSCWSGQIVGRQLELVPGKRIVQAWRVSAWPAGVYSIVRIELEPKGNGTHLTLYHTGLPDGSSSAIAAGWPMRYWDRMKKHFGEA
jgi:activator of HSP90 ATPase